MSRRERIQVSTSSRAKLPSRSGCLVCIFLFAVLLGAGAWAGKRFMSKDSPLESLAVTLPLREVSPSKREPSTYEDILGVTPGELATIDLATMNLLCAQGLPGAESLDMPALPRELDEWVERVRFETRRHLYRVKDPRYTEHYAGSEARLRAEFLVQVLQEDCGVHYNLARVSDPDFRNSKDGFIHGMIGSDNGGTCVSMPVLYACVAQRLGYPVRLVLAKQHVFC
jgi:hypothetical protein